MNPLSILPDSESEIGLYYIIPFSQLYLYQTDGKRIHMYLTVIGFLATVTMHTYLRAVFGPGLDESDISGETAVRKRIMTALYGNKKTYAQPETFGEALDDLEFSISRAKRIIVSGLAFCSFIGIYTYSLYQYWRVFPEWDLLGQMVALGLVFPLAEHFSNSLWIAAHKYPDEIPEVSDHSQEIANEFTYMFRREGIQIEQLKYDLADGGVIDLGFSTESDTREDIMAEIHRAGFAYCGLVERFEYPTVELRATVQHGDEQRGNFRVESTWVEDFAEGHLSKSDFVQRIDNTGELLIDKNSENDQ